MTISLKIAFCLQSCVNKLLQEWSLPPSIKDDYIHELYVKVFSCVSRFLGSFAMNLGIFSYRFRLLEQLGIHFRGFELIKPPLNMRLMRHNDNQNTEYNAC